MGGVLGLALALIGLSGALLLWKPCWVGIPQVRRVADPSEQLAIVEAAEALGARAVVLPSRDFGAGEARLPGDAGAYLDHRGAVLAQWSNTWQRPETWLFDLHHHLLMGDNGRLLAGWLGMAAALFVVSGCCLWWRARRGFRLRVWPQRLARPSILRHHQDLGIVVALPLLIAATTGSLLVLKPLQEFLLAPLSPAEEIEAWREAVPKVKPHAPVNWPAVLARGTQHFPEAELRIVTWPKAGGEPIQLRLRQSGEWHPNGRTVLSVAPDGTVVAVRDAREAPTALKANHLLYPLHSGRLAGSGLALPWKLVLTAAGLGLTLLGSLAVVTFWGRLFARPRKRKAT